jgi:hypothetical protein
LWGGRKDSDHEGFHIGFEAGGAAGFTVRSVRLAQGTEICGHCTTDFTIQGQKVGDADGEWSDIYSYRALLPSTNVLVNVMDDICEPLFPPTTTLSPTYTSVPLGNVTEPFDSVTDDSVTTEPLDSVTDPLDSVTEPLFTVTEEALVCNFQQPPCMFLSGHSTPINVAICSAA